MPQKSERSESNLGMWPRLWKRPARIIKLFGALNLALGVLGFYLLGSELNRFAHHSHSLIGVAPYLNRAFYAITAVDFACLVALVIGGAYLLLIHRRGALICNVLFSAEVASSLLGEFALLAIPRSHALAPILNSIAAASVLATLGTAPQFIPIYPIIALVFINISYRNLRQASKQCAVK